MESYGERWVRGWRWAGETPESGEEKRQSDRSIPQKGRGSPQTNFISQSSLQPALCGSDGKESACNARDLGSIPGSGRSLGEGNGKPLQYSCLENLMDGEAW